MALKFIKCEGLNDVLFRKISIDSLDSNLSIIVSDTHNAIIVRDGIAYETLSAGRYKLCDKKFNFMQNLDQAPFVDVIFVSKTARLNLLWGTTTQFDMRDPITNTSIKLGASGELEVQISNPRKAYLELIGQRESFDIDDLKERLQGRLLSEVQYHIANIMKGLKLSYDRLGEVLLPVSNAVLPHVAEMFEEDYGLKVYSFTISRVIISDGDIEKINKARDNLNRITIAEKEAENKERLDEKKYQREVDLKRLEREDYDRYLEVCKIIGWPTGKKSAGAQESEKDCPNCGAKVKDTMKFCSVCGLELVKSKIKCPNCGKLITKDDMFCKHCGAKVRD